MSFKGIHMSTNGFAAKKNYELFRIMLEEFLGSSEWEGEILFLCPETHELQSRIQALEAEAVRLVAAVNFYANTSGKTKRIRGQMIEVDPDAGPLYDYYEVPLCDLGETAREALAACPLSREIFNNKEK